METLILTPNKNENIQETAQLLEEMNINSFLKCVRCNSPLIKKRGNYKHKDGTTKQKYSCNECGKYFVFFPNRPKPEMVVQGELLDYAVRLRRLGFSYHKIKEYIKDRKNKIVSVRAVWNAITKKKNA
ncbi:MAG: hypothetical protein AABY22_34495 [Nanoarchaeota archaeon]